MIKTLAIGQSNLAGVANAAKAMVKADRFPSALSMAFIQMREPKYNPPFQAGRNGALNPALSQDIETQSAGVGLGVSCIGGNAHSTFGLLNHPRPYDFVLDVDPAIPLHPGREVVPCRLVRATLEAQMKEGLRLFAAVRALCKAPFVHCESPPPIPSEAHIRAHPGVFKNKIDVLGVAPPAFRLKLWKLQSDIYRKFCDSQQIVFLPVPPEVFDADSMLNEKAWGADPTHGNTWYGERVILQLANYAQALPGRD